MSELAVLSRADAAGQPAPRRRWINRRRVAWGIGTAAWIVAIAWLLRYAFVEGWRLHRELPWVKLGAGPLVGEWDLRLSLKVVPAVVIAVVAVVALPRLVAHRSAGTAIAVSVLVAIVFTWALAASDGWSAVLRPVTHPTEYWSGLSRVDSAGEYLRTYLDRQGGYSVHVRGHPPGFPLALLALRAVGLGSAWWAAGLSFLGVGLSVAGVAFTLHRVAGLAAMRRSLPFLVLVPFAVWQGTSADAFFAGVVAAGVALLAVAMTTDRARFEVAAGLAGGTLLGASCFLTFGAPTLIPLVLALAIRTRRIRWVVPALAGVAAVVALFALGGYWWLDGLNNTRRFYEEGTAQFRPGFYFFFANLAALAIAIGPAPLAGLTRLARHGAAAVVVGAIGCVLLADASGLCRAETERIWLLYMPWIAVAAGSLATSMRRQQVLLAVQAVTVVLLQVSLVSKW